jgi:hypothetical protein
MRATPRLGQASAASRTSALVASRWGAQAARHRRYRAAMDTASRSCPRRLAVPEARDNNQAQSSRNIGLSSRHAAYPIRLRGAIRPSLQQCPVRPSA